MLMKDDLIKMICVKLDVSFKDGELLYDAVIDTIMEGILQDDVFINKLGKFYAYKLKARKARNPRTGEELITPEKIKIGFKQSKNLKAIASKLTENEKPKE